MKNVSPYVKRLGLLTGWIGLAYCLFALSLFVIQRQVMYFPDPVPFNPAAWALPEVKALDATTSDNLVLRSYYAPPSKKGQRTIVFFQGNGGHLGLRNYKARSWLDHGYGVLLVGYRGYGNPGLPSEEGLYADARAAMDAMNKKGIAVQQMVLYGESLGTGVAVQMAMESPDVAGVVLESPYTSIPDVLAFHYSFLPIHWMVHDQFDTLSKINSVRAPLLVLQGLEDRIVPQRMARTVFDAANEPKEAVFQPKADHGTIYNEASQKALWAFMKRLGR